MEHGPERSVFSRNEVYLDREMNRNESPGSIRIFAPAELVKFRSPEKAVLFKATWSFTSLSRVASAHFNNCFGSFQ